jgi:hypothetical protein
MRMLLSLLGAIAIIGLILAWECYQQVDLSRAELADAEASVVAAKKQLAELRLQRPDASSRGRTPRGGASDLVRTRAATTEAMNAAAQKNLDERNTALLASSNLQLLYEDSRRAMYHTVFAALFRRLHLSTDQQNALITAAVTADMKGKDLEAVMKEKHLSRNDPAIKAQRADADAALERDVAAVLGPDGLKTLREDSRFSSARDFATSYGGLLSRVGEPLTFDQIEAVTAAVAEASPGPFVDPAKLTTAQWDRVYGRIQTILSSAQWEVFRSTTPPRQYANRWESAVNEALAQATAEPPKE